MFDIRGRTALVTGASRGIGRAIALGLAEYGADVTVHHLAETDEAESCAQAIRTLGRRAAIVAADLTNEGAADEVAMRAIDALGSVDILVINAALERRQEWTDIGRADFDHSVSVNIWSGLRLMQRCIPDMVARNWGRVLTIGSIQQLRPNPRSLVYAAMKTAQVNMVRNIARQVAAAGITVNNLAPGSILTPRSAEALANPTFRASIEAKIPAARIGRPEDCVGAALLLCSEAGSYITGCDLLIDGGWSINDG